MNWFQNWQAPFSSQNTSFLGKKASVMNLGLSPLLAIKKKKDRVKTCYLVLLEAFWLGCYRLWKSSSKVLWENRHRAMTPDLYWWWIVTAKLPYERSHLRWFWRSWGRWSSLGGKMILPTYLLTKTHTCIKILPRFRPQHLNLHLKPKSHHFFSLFLEMHKSFLKNLIPHFTFFLKILFLIIVYPRRLDIVPCAIKQDLVIYPESHFLSSKSHWKSVDKIKQW